VFSRLENNKFRSGNHPPPCLIALGLDPTDGASISPVIVPLDPATGTFTCTRRDPAPSGLAYAIKPRHPRPPTQKVTAWRVVPPIYIFASVKFCTQKGNR